MIAAVEAARFCDELGFAFGWRSERKGLLRMVSHALVADGRVWLVDATASPEAEERVRGVGEPAGVVQLVDRHNRDGAAVAARLGVPLHRIPGALPESPFELMPVVRHRWWREVALWWPERRVLVCGDALGTVPYFVGPGERLAVHPLLRLTPPRALARLDPEHVLVGHGEAAPGDALGEALDSARRRAPLWAVTLPVQLLAGRRRSRRAR